MTDRHLRRAAERKAAKLARKELNRQNAQLSTGPRTEEGKSISCQNALKTGLTSRLAFLPSDDRAAYQRHLAAYETEYQPAGLRERELVRSIADTQWRLQRIPALEMAIYARGREEFADDFLELDPEQRNARIDLETTLRYEKSLRNLHLQESRLRRHREKDVAELKALQSARKAAEAPESLASFFQTAPPLPVDGPPQTAQSSTSSCEETVQCANVTSAAA